MVSADPAQVGSVMDNLINNALHYASDAPHIQVALRSVGADAAEIVVEDHGIGIAATEHEHVFDHFTRLADSATGPRSGTGLGLTIARELAERNRGCLELVRSAPGLGSVFRLRLPTIVPALVLEGTAS